MRGGVGLGGLGEVGEWLVGGMASGVMWDKEEKGE